MAKKSSQTRAVLELELDADELKAAAADSVAALDRLDKELRNATKDLDSMQKSLRRLKQGGYENSQQAKDLTAQIAATQQRIAKADALYRALGGDAAKLARQNRSAAKSFETLLKEAAKTSGAIGALAKTMLVINERLGAKGGKGATARALALAAAMAYLTTKTVQATKALYRYGVAQADARRSELLGLEAMTKRRNFWRVQAGNAQQMQESIDRVSASVSIGRDKIAAYQQQLYRAGLRAKNLDQALLGMSMTMSGTQSEEEAQWFAYVAGAAARAGGSIEKLTNTVRNRLGGIVSRQMSSLTVQTQKLQESFAALFADLPIDPLLKAKREFNELFSQSTESGKALKALLRDLLTPLIRASTVARRTMKTFFQGVILGLLEVEGAILDVLVWWKRTFGLPIFKFKTDSKIVFEAARLAVKGFLVVVVLMSASLAVFAVKIAPLAIGAIWKLTYAINFMGLRWAVVAGKWLAVGAWRVLGTVIMWVARQLFFLSMRGIGSLIAGFVRLLPVVASAVVSFGAFLVELLIAAAPFLAAAAAAYVLAKAVVWLLDWFSGTKWGKKFKEIWGAFTEWLSPIGDWFKSLGDRISSWFGEQSDAAKASGRDLAKSLSSGFDQGMPSFDSVEGYGKGLGNALSSGFEESLPGLASDLDASLMASPPKFDIPSKPTTRGFTSNTTNHYSIGDINITLEPKEGEAPEETGKRAAASFSTSLMEQLRTVNDQMGGRDVAMSTP